jgi:hypothetical protein
MYLYDLHFFENGFTPFSKFKKTEFKTSFGIF